MQLGKKSIYLIIFYTIFLLTIFYISGIVGVLEFILSIIIYFLIFYFLHILWSKLRKKTILNINNFILYFLHRLSIFFIIIFILIGSFAYYNNEISPASMPEMTISNGQKTIVFQAMSHIGTPEFYETIKNNLKEKKQEGYVYFFEGVKQGTPENTEKFNKALGVKFDDELYKNFSKLYGVSNQDNSIFYGLINDLDFNVDLTLDQIVQYYEKEIKNIESQNKYIPDTPIDISKQVTEALIGLNDKQLKILVYINQSILNFLMKSEKIQETLTNNFTNKKLFNIILHKRNEVVSNEIINSEYNKIFLTYGLLHLKGILKLLQKDDNNWKIIGEKRFFPIK